jgi:hypothetical protein
VGGVDWSTYVQSIKTGVVVVRDERIPGDDQQAYNRLILVVMAIHEHVPILEEGSG